MNPVSCTAGLTLLWPPIFTPRVRVPLYADPCAAGFPTPAQDYVEKELDLNELCIRRRASTFFVRASGNSMRDMGLCDGDVTRYNGLIHDYGLLNPLSNVPAVKTALRQAAEELKTHLK
ncbi:S24 family peptidase [Pantoea sp. SORGH_AS_0659]|uniref:S24 family peptidase n=1 Tax=Pantoea sp. SORGH_AS_0659 TaxID=3062597 RepID=UPI0028558331|nr:S24 family peptidase [Pantoea sp. SORGH_AS_0659]MDR6349093.1 acetyl esterase/lipase [Pantoea sp. SORGH_AS_0659]